MKTFDQELLSIFDQNDLHDQHGRIYNLDETSLRFFF